MYKVIAYAETVTGCELRVPLGKFETEEQANKFCQSNDLCNNEIIIKLCAYYPDLELWDFSHKILYVDWKHRNKWTKHLFLLCYMKYKISILSYIY